MMKLKLERLKLHVKGPIPVKGLKEPWRIGEIREVPVDIGTGLLDKYPNYFAKVASAKEEKPAGLAKLKSTAPKQDKMAVAASNKGSK